MEHPGQIVVPQTAVTVFDDGEVEARFTVGLPANGRRVLGRAAANLVTGTVPDLVRSALFVGVDTHAVLEDHAATNEDADALRAQLVGRGLVGFVADGARLPRRSGIDDTPLEGVDVVPFESPPSMRVELETPNSGSVVGMGVPEGVTLIVGGGFHGKSTLLRALEAGVYNHRPGDGREQVVTRVDAAKVRAEDGRAVSGVDISGFIDGLPGGRDTCAFSTPNASGSTSQAATIVEAVEAGARLLLLDEDTSATNFMIRDRRMQELVPAAGEPITPFVDRVRALVEEHAISTVIVMGGSGDYLDVADRIVRMDAYRPADVTDEARRVADALPTGREAADPAWALPTPRRLAAKAYDVRKGRRERHVRVPDGRTLLLGRESVDLVAVEQLVNRAQIRAIGAALAWASESLLDQEPTLPELLDAAERSLGAGLDAFEPRRVGNLAAFRRIELAAVLNRVRGLRVE